MTPRLGGEPAALMQRYRLTGLPARYKIAPSATRGTYDDARPCHAARGYARI
jgi:hypothetical protein